MKIIIDVNLAVRWADMLLIHEIEAVHWRSIGAANAPDIEIMSYARQNGYAVFTNDLDFSAILVSTHAKGPSVIQIRAEDTRPEIHNMNLLLIKARLLLLTLLKLVCIFSLSHFRKNRNKISISSLFLPSS